MLGWNGESNAGARAFAGVSVAFALVACGGKAHEGPSAAIHGDTSGLFGSGTRLKAHYLDGGGGARDLIDFRDTSLGIDCQFVQTASAEYHCLPVASVNAFLDSACTQPVAFPGNVCSADLGLVAGMMVTAGTSMCGARASAYSLVDLEDVGATFTSTPGGGCLAPLSAPSRPRKAWSLQAEPLEHFVAGTPSLVGAAGGVQAQRVTGDDGSFVNLGLVFAGVSCTAVASGSALECVPGPPTVPSPAVYANDNCSDAAVGQAVFDLNQKCSGEEPQYIVASDTRDCKPETSIYAAGAVLDNAFEDTGTCQPIAAADPVLALEFSYVQMGARVPLSTFPRVIAGGVGSGAVTVACWADSNGAPISENSGVAAAYFWNLSDGAPCHIVPGADGQKRCVNHAVWMNQSFYSDASCTEAVYWESDADCSSSVQYLIAGDDGICKEDLMQAYVANAYSGPMYSLLSGSCESTEPDAYYRFFTPGAPVAPETFPAIAERTDP